MCNLGHQCGCRKKTQAVCGFSHPWGQSKKWQWGQGVKKKTVCVLVLVSLAGASGKTELYPVVSCFKKLFSACRLLLRATWGWSIYALSFTQTQDKTSALVFNFILKVKQLWVL